MKIKFDKLKIEKGVAIPKEKTALQKFMEKLKVGDSFVINKKATPYFYGPAKKLGWKMMARVTDGQETRMWRIK